MVLIISKSSRLWEISVLPLSCHRSLFSSRNKSNSMSQLIWAASSYAKSFCSQTSSRTSQGSTLSSFFLLQRTEMLQCFKSGEGKTKDSSECILEVHETRVPGLMAPTKRRWLSETGCLSSRDDQASNIPSWVILQQSFVLECFWQPLTVAQRLSVSNPKFASPLYAHIRCLPSFFWDGLHLMIIQGRRTSPLHSLHNGGRA